MATIPQKELRNNIGEILRRAGTGERFTVTVSGRPVAELGPVRDRSWIHARHLGELWKLPAEPSLARDLETFQVTLADPWRP